MTNVAKELSRTVKVASQPQSNLSGSTTDYGAMIQSIPALPAFVYSLGNAGTVTENFIIGDPSGMIAASLGTSPSNPDSINGSSGLVTANKNMFYSSSVLFGEISWKTSSDASQFDQTPTVYVTNHTGQLIPKPIILTAAERNTQYNNKLLTTKGDVRLDAFRALYVPVIAGETLTVTMMPKAYTT